MGARRDDRVDLEARQVVGARQRVVHQRAGEQLPRLRVVAAALEHRLPQPLRQAAMHLACDDHRIHEVAEVVDRGEALERRAARLGVHLHLADVAARRIREVGRVVERALVEARLQLVERVVVRHVGGERHLPERHLLVGARHLELAVLEHDVGVGRFHQVRRDLLALRDHLVDRLHDRGAAHCERAAAVGAHAERDAPGVAVHDLDVADRDAEPARHHLRESGLVALPVAVRAGEHRHRAGGMHPHFAGFEQARACTERTRDVGRREPAGLDVAGIAQPAQPPPCLGRRAARREVGHVGQLLRLRQVRGVVAGVVGETHRRGVRELGDEVLPADRRGLHLQVARRLLDEPLDDIRGLGPPRAAVGIHRRGVREHRLHLAVDGRRLVLAGEQRGVQDGRHARREGGQVCAEVGRGHHPHREEVALRVGARADLLISDAADAADLVASGPLERCVLVNGRVVAGAL